MAKLLIAAFLVAGLAGCSGSDEATSDGSNMPLRCTTPTDPDPVLGTPFNVHAGEQATIASERLTLRFAQLIGDSRCPVGMLCLIAGQVDVAIHAEHPPDNATDFTLSSYNAPSTHATYSGFDIQLVDALPRPEAGRPPTDASDYCVQLTVVRASP